MSDKKDDVVKSKISMDLKSRKMSEKAIDKTDLESKEVEQPSESLDSKVSHSDSQDSYSHDSYSHDSNAADVKTIRKSDGPNKRMFLFPIIILGVLLISSMLALLISLAGDVGHYYYVESTISLPSDNETQTTTLSLGACIQDYTEQATPNELISMLHDEYSYSKKENDLVQNLVSTGCDTTLPLPTIKNGSFFNAF